MNRIIVILIVLIAVALSCTEKIDVKLDQTYTRIVLNGGITNESKDYQIALTTSSDYFANAPAPVVPNAEVQITDGDTTVTLTETQPGKSGIYQTTPDFHGKIGKTYLIRITTAQLIAGKSEFHAACKLNSVTKLDSIKVTFDANIGKEGVWYVKVYAQDPANERNFYMMNLYRNGKLWSDTIYKVSVSDDQFYNGNYIIGAVAFYISNARKWETLNIGDTVTVQMCGITREYFDYINQVKQIGFNIPFFTGPPANVVGNIDNGGIGFFTAYSTTYATTIVK